MKEDDKEEEDDLKPWNEAPIAQPPPPGFDYSKEVEKRLALLLGKEAHEELLKKIEERCKNAKEE